MSEIFTENGDALRRAVLDQPVWGTIGNSYCEGETMLMPGYIMVEGETIDPKELAAPIQERLGLTEVHPHDRIELYLARKYDDTGEMTRLEDTGENAMVVRLARSGGVAWDENGDNRSITGKWINADYFVSPTEVSADPDVPPLTSVSVRLTDETESARALYSGGNFFAALSEVLSEDEDIAERQLDNLSTERIIELGHAGDPDNAEAAKQENAVNDGMAEFAAMAPVTDNEALALAGLVRRIQATRMM